MPEASVMAEFAIVPTCTPGEKLALAKPLLHESGADNVIRKITVVFRNEPMLSNFVARRGDFKRS
jgi:hypothetical protein